MANNEDFIEKLKISLNTEPKSDISKELKNRREIYLSPQSSALDAYILAGICFRISNTCKDNVTFKITTRAKSLESSIKKKKRFQEENRKDSKLYDLIASKLVIRRINENDELLGGGFSDEFLALYQRRKEDINLMGSVINFFNEQAEIGEFYSEYDKPETTEIKLEALKKAFNEDFGNNIQRYRKNVDITKIKRPNLENEIINIIQNFRFEEKDENNEKNDERYRRAIEFLNGEETVLPFNNGEEENIEDIKDQEEYLKYAIVLLKRNYELEYEECERERREIKNELKNKIFEFSHLTKGNSFKNNVTLEDLEELERLSKKINAQMSDKLQNKLIEDIMGTSVALSFQNQGLNVGLEKNDDYSIKVDKKRRSNGYASNHYTLIKTLGKEINIQLELQAMTYYRSKVATNGNAAYGNGRENEKVQEEKKRPLYLMPKYVPNKEYKDESGELKKDIVIEKFGRLEDMDEEKISEWKKEIEMNTPKYYTTSYEKENDAVVFTFHSMYNNAKLYYSETNDRKQRNFVKNGFEIIDEKKLLDNNEKIIRITRDEYNKAIKDGRLEKLVQSVEDLYNKLDKENDEDELEESKN